MNDSPEGEEIYFVLMMNCLHLYKNSKSEFPTSYVPIEKGFAFVSLNNDAFAAGNFVISLETPVRSLLLKAKHEVRPCFILCLPSFASHPRALFLNRRSTSRFHSAVSLPSDRGSSDCAGRMAGGALPLRRGAVPARVRARHGCCCPGSAAVSWRGRWIKWRWPGIEWRWPEVGEWFKRRSRAVCVGRVSRVRRGRPAAAERLGRRRGGRRLARVPVVWRGGSARGRRAAARL